VRLYILSFLISISFSRRIKMLIFYHTLTGSWRRACEQLFESYSFQEKGNLQ